MPIMTGIEAIILIKKLYADYNRTHMARRGVCLVRPAIFFFSQYSKHQMNHFIKEDEHSDFYLEKPVPESEIWALITLLNITP